MSKVLALAVNLLSEHSRLLDWKLVLSKMLPLFHTMDVVLPKGGECEMIIFKEGNVGGKIYR
jgi:hypothetical protein